jgi:hypothetical protein
MRTWFSPIWSDIKGASVRGGHPAPYPVELAARLIRMFSFAGDTVLDPFLGTGSTSLAAIRTGRNSVGVELEPSYLKIARSRAIDEASKARLFGPRQAVKWPRAAGPFLAAVKLEGRLLVVLYQAAKGCVRC